MIKILQENVTNNHLAKSVNSHEYECIGEKYGCAIMQRKELPIPEGEDVSINIAIASNYLLVQYKGPRDKENLERELIEFIRNRFADNNR